MKAGVVGGLAVLSALAIVAVSSSDLGSLLFDAAEPVEAAHADRNAPLRRAVARKTQSGTTSMLAPASRPALRVLNAGTVDDDPVRHEETVAAIERVASDPAALTDDDDLTPTGTHADWYPPKLKTFRTVCVRLCDGALTPVSFATTQDRLALDALRCRKSCVSPSKLYIQRNPAGETEGLIDLDGKPYGQLKTAFKFRTSYDDACTCRPHAWQSVARSRHRLFEIQARKSRGRELVLVRLAAIKSGAVKAARVAASSRVPSPPSLAPPPAIVTGSTKVSPSGSSGAMDTVVLGAALAAAPRKVTSKRKAKAIALAKAKANSKAARTKAQQDTALLVLFGPGVAPGVQADEAKPGKLTSAVRSLNGPVRSASSTRRYDGNDWRISTYEPM